MQMRSVHTLALVYEYRREGCRGELHWPRAASTAHGQPLRWLPGDSRGLGVGVALRGALEDDDIAVALAEDVVINRGATGGVSPCYRRRELDDDALAAAWANQEAHRILDVGLGA